MSVIKSKVNPQTQEFKDNQTEYGKMLDTLRESMAYAVGSGRDAQIERHHSRDKLLARERIDLLIDDGTPFLELSSLAAWGQYDNAVPCAGIVTGIGLISGAPVMIIANDATVKAGSFFHETVKKHVRAQEIAEENRMPTIYLVDCGGAYLPEQDRVFPDKDHFGNTFLRQCQMSNTGLTQISAVFGGCTAGGAYIPALSDEVVMVKGNARIHLGGPSIVKAAINEDVDGETLGGADMHTRVSGVSDYMADDEYEAIALVREIITKANIRRDLSPPDAPKPPRYDASEITGIVSDIKHPYDAREIIARMVDDSEFREFKPQWGETLVCGTANIHGFPVGIIGNNGVIFSDSALKGAHFIELCCQRNIPLLFLHNITGNMVGTEAERGGIAKDSAKMFYAMACARVPRFSVLVGGSYGAGNYVMCGRGLNPRFLFAWPTAELATMNGDTAANVLVELNKSSLKSGKIDQKKLDEIADRTRAQYKEQSGPYYATSRLWDDGLIEPADTRDIIGLCLALAASEPEVEPDNPVYRM